MMKRLLLSTLLCVAPLLLNASDDQYAPINQESLTKTISYHLSPLGFVNAGRRKSAYKSMWQACGGKYEIVQEYDTLRGAIGSQFGNNGFATALKSHVIEYRCVP
jgi:hypothetical protein